MSSRRSSRSPMAPTQKKSSICSSPNISPNPGVKKSRWILSCFGFGSTQKKTRLQRKKHWFCKIKKDATVKDEKTAVVEKWSLQFSVDHFPVAAKQLLIDQQQPSLVVHESQVKQDSSEKCMKQFEYQGKESSCDAKFQTNSSFNSLGRSNSEHINEFSSQQTSSLKSCIKNPAKIHSTRSSSAKSRRVRRRFEWDAIAAMSVLMVILTIMLVFGRLCAILCASISFYCMPRLIKTGAKTIKLANETKVENFELDSETYRKKVILQGLLERKSNIYFGIS